MNTHEAIRQGMETANEISMGYLNDLTDEEMMHRPHPGCNHIKWQLSHLIQSEHSMIEDIFPGSMPPLPDGFAQKYAKEAATSDDAAGSETVESGDTASESADDATAESGASESEDAQDASGTS